MLTTRLTRRLGIRHPIISAPMAFASGGRLAATVTQAGGLGLIGGGYGDRAWLEREIAAAGNARVGCGFITWSLREQPELLEIALAHAPAAIFLSFDDPEPFAARIKRDGVTLICQVQNIAQARTALAAGADIVVAQGSEAGGHGAVRGTVTLVAEIANVLAAEAPETLLCAAGGFADGRGLAAALMLGADGVVVGSRLWASAEALVHPGLTAAAMAASGDDTIRTSVTDIVRRKAWPAGYTIRVLRNDLTDRWHGREAELRADLTSVEREFARAMEAGDARIATPIVGEAAGLIAAVEPAAEIVQAMVHEAARCLQNGAKLVN